jgi:CheY-like chemotaxis protein
MGKRILCVDDDKDWRFVLETTLSGAGYEVITVENASEAWTRADQFQPDLVILDLDLAGENGLMLMKFLKENSPEVRVMLYTGTEQDAEIIMQALDQGAQAYVRKGPPEELLREVEALLQ